MRTWSAVTLVIAGLSLWGCSEEKAGPGVGPDTSWQVGCAITGSGCGSSLDAHGPLAGLDAEEEDDDQKLEVSCSKTAAGLQIEIEDPGREQDETEARPRARSILKISNAKPADNKCFVQLTEYSRGGTMYVLSEVCANSSGSFDGTCELTGEEDSNGYAFEGTLLCGGLRNRNAGAPNYKLGAARDIDEPIKLQIMSCK